MAMEPVHSKLITTAARHVLRPIGLRQKGRSRTWLDDRGWWVCVVEFQPSSWSQGSYLNVGCMWLWSVKNYLSFDEGSRVEAFSKFLDHAQFEVQATRLANRAAEEVRRYRLQFPNIDSVSEFYVGRPSMGPGHWQNFHAGVACGISGKPNEAVRFFDQFLALTGDRPEWLVTAQADAERLKALSADTIQFHTVIANRVRQTRELQKLPCVTTFNFDDAGIPAGD